MPLARAHFPSMQSNFTNTGRQFETALEKTIIHYTGKGILRLKKVAPPTRTFGGGKKTPRQIMHLKNPFLDFVGCWTRRGGRAIMMEAKSTKVDKLCFGSNGITQSQLDAMHHWTFAGAVTFVLWQYGDSCTLFTINDIDGISRERKHLRMSDGYPVKQGMGMILYDFEAAMAKIWPVENLLLTFSCPTRVDSTLERPSA